MESGRGPQANSALAAGGARARVTNSLSASGGGNGQSTCRNPDPLLTEAEAARYIGYKPRTLAGWRYRGGGPVYVATSKTSVRYRLSDLEAWIASRRRRSTSDFGAGGV
jgi:predicted DNA-binding transcriptional regulator AlpA